MYRTCLFCSADLGANEALEAFPVGRSLAFDSRKGRLWAVCGRCGRWNLAPLEERWEAVEAAEREFVDARLRVHSENIGLARLPDGTRLIRVGRALPGELAAWRYGDQLVRRRRRYLTAAGLVGAAGAAYAGLVVVGALGGAAGLFQLGTLAWQRHHGRRVVHRVPPSASHTGTPIVLRRYNLNGAWLTREGGDPALHLPHGLDPVLVEDDAGRPKWLPVRELVLVGGQARAVLARALVHTNRKGASSATLRHALDLLVRAGDPDAYLRSVAGEDRRLGVPEASATSGLGLRRLVGTFRGERIPDLSGPPLGLDRREALPAPRALALEMALHEEAERRALEGELAELEAAWREAEEIAGIADALPEDPLDRLTAR